MGISIKEAEHWLDAKLFPPVGNWGASLPHHPEQYVSTCCWGGAERSREIHLPRLPAKPTQAVSQKKLVCCIAGGLSDLPERNLGLIPWGISAKEVTHPMAMWALAERGSHSGHPILTDDPVVKVGGATLQEEDQYSVDAATYQPFSQSKSHCRFHDRRGWHAEALLEAREAQKWALEATHQLELDIKRLSQGVGNVQWQWPCSCSDSCLQSKSLDRQDRSPSWCRLERHVTFCEPEVEPFLGRGHHQEPGGHFPQVQTRRGEEGLLSTRRTKIPCPWEMPVAYLDVKNRIGYPSEPSIGNYEVWLNWQAHQLDTPPWWRELVAIPEVEHLKRSFPEDLGLLPDSSS